jgi:hypothetical protein
VKRPSEVGKVIAILALFFFGRWVASMVWFRLSWDF